MNDTQILRSLMESMQKTSQPKTSPYDTTAEVRRIEDGVAWVHIAGGVDETPVRLTINAKEGDNVQVRVSGGTAFLVGNGTSPPTDDTRANIAKMIADGAVASLKIQQAEIDRLKAKYIETLFIASPDYMAEDIPWSYPSDSIYPDATTWASGGVNVVSGFAIDLTRGLILGGFYSKALAELDARVTALERRNTLSMSLASPMMQTADTDTEDDDGLR